ncbi:thioredoxin family protein [Roseibium sp. RKSG952]|uniref:DUF1223 domain-containing protein n=1 Tax=Roseibium sp. RKSG952 TaxID=2529384 RepID=UPI0012BC0A9C|nr:DUF1223 domain-containing protein [Roseibium sp. RKSG952]MTH98225.1 DUF1223 domain-containing protein [Roseibium sp. RKSG952]
MILRTKSSLFSRSRPKFIRSRRRFLAAILGLSLLPSLQTADAQDGPQVVAELFTSQGCSSCPPADRLLKDLSRNDGILALSLNVDYWDYLGWRDTLAHPAHTQRQRAYAAQRGDRSVYTPQLVVNGTEHVIGSKERDVAAAMSRAEPFTAKVDVTMTDVGLKATVTGDLPPGTRMATVFFVRIRNAVEVAIDTGENAGNSYTYANVAQPVRPIGMWSGGRETFRMPKSELMKNGSTRCAVLIQLENADGPGRIIGAGVMDW